MKKMQTKQLDDAQIGSILAEILRDALQRVLRQEAEELIDSDEAIDARIAEIDSERTELRRCARARDWSLVEPDVTCAAQQVNIAPPDPLPAQLGRPATSLIREIRDVEAQALDGEDARTLAAPLVERYASCSVDDFVAAPVLLSTAWTRALELHPARSMKGNIDAIAKLALTYFGDIPVTAISESAQEEFFAWMARLPKKHGKSHGKNRYCPYAPKNPERYRFSKQDEITEADAIDEGIMQEIRGMNHLSNTEKRALLSERLVPRLSLTTLRRNRDGLNRMFKAAADLGCKAAPAAISYRKIESVLDNAAPDCPLYVRVTQPKIRMPWTEERLAQFLTSPIYTGCFSPHRRARPGKVIIRDSLYWVPLIVLTIGSRIGEILMLKRKNLIYRNRTYCLAIGLDSEQRSKTEDGQRVIPIPQLLIDLGFVEWVQGLDDDHGPLLFPDAAGRTTKDDLTGPFSKALNRILDQLGLGDFDEDFYAMRKPLSSMLRAAEISDGQRQAIAGHSGGTILNRHYTAHNVRDLKRAVDSADFEILIEQHPKYGFPTISGCSLANAESVEIDVTLDDHGGAAHIAITGDEEDGPLFEFERIDPRTGDKRPQTAVREAAREFKKLVASRSMRLPRSRMKRSAIEHFHALA